LDLVNVLRIAHHTARVLIVGASLWGVLVAPLAHAEAAVAAPGACIPAAQCCKVCDAGQACGNSCISRSKTCHKGQGCACDASNVCER
jgi:hypothetical protein